MNDSQSPRRLTKREHLLTLFSSALTGFGAIGVFGHGLMIHPALARPDLAWPLFLVGLGLSAYVSVGVVLRLNRAAQHNPPATASPTPSALSKTTNKTTKATNKNKTKTKQR